MSGFDPGYLGAFLIILAFLLVGMVILVSRSLAGGRQASSRLVELPFSDLMVTMKDDAVILVQIGGAVWHMNDLAREWFGYKGNEPNLERLARRTKPSEGFFRPVCITGASSFLIGWTFGRIIVLYSFALRNGWVNGSCFTALAVSRKTRLRFQHRSRNIDWS